MLFHLIDFSLKNKFIARMIVSIENFIGFSLEIC